MSLLSTKLVQRYLKSLTLYGGAVDGDYGKKTREAVDNLLKMNTIEHGEWGELRRRVAAEQLIIKKAGFLAGKVDGLIGPNTLDALERYQNHLVDAESLTPPEPSIHRWPVQNQSELIKFYGQPNTRQVKCELPYEMRIAWDTKQTIKSFSCHELVKDSFEKVFEDTLKHYGINAVKVMGLDLFGGCLNHRAKRGGNSLSLHSWGIAVDLDPVRNGFRATSKTANMATDQFDAFWQIVESQGLVSLGRERNFDWMHFQAARLA